MTVVPREWPLPEPKPVYLDNKYFLVVVDMQKEYCDPSGSKFFNEARLIIPNTKNLLSIFRANHLKIFYTVVAFKIGDMRFRGLEHRLKPLKDEPGFEIVEQLRPRENEIIVEKDCYDPFYSSDIEELLIKEGLKPFESTAVVTGVVTTTCVYHTISGLFHRGYKVVVPIDCVADRTIMAQRFGLWKFVTLYNTILTMSGMIKKQ